MGAAETTLGCDKDADGELEGTGDGSDEGTKEGSTLLILGSLEDDKDG